MSQRPILPMAYAASRATLFQWDKFVLPWPFSRIVIAVGPPRQVPRTLQPAALEALQKEMAAELKRLFGVARDACATAARMSVELSVVVPVCNEAENVEPLAREIDAALAGRAYEMIFIDDGSTDDTAAILHAAQERRCRRCACCGIRSAAGRARRWRAACARRARRGWPRSTATARTIRPTSPGSSRRATRAEGRGVQLFMGNRKASRKDTAFRRLQSSIANGVRQQFAGRRHARHGLRHQAVFARRCSWTCRASITCIVSCRRCSSAMARA